MEFDTQQIRDSFHEAIDNSNAFILYLNSMGNIIACNKKIESLTGKKKDQVLGRYWLSVLYNNHGEQNLIKQHMFKAVMDDSIKYKRPNSFEGALVDSQEHEHLVSWDLTPVTEEPKGLMGMLLVGNDVTQLKDREESFKKIDNTLKNIFSNIKEYALYVTNLDGNITYYGMGSEIMFGWQKNEIVFKHISILHTLEDAASALQFIISQVNAKGEHETEIDLVKKDGQHFPVELTVSRFIDPDGKPAGYIFIAKDITERRKLEYQVFQAEKMAAIGQLAAGMAHEINNPLFVISGRMEMMLEGKRLAKKIKDNLNIMNAQTERIRKLVDRLLKFSRKTIPRLENLNINEVIEGVLPLLSYHKLPASSVEIDRVLAPNLSPVRGDLNQLQEVFINILVNAYQAMPQGGKIAIETRNSQDGFAEITIADTGHGISEDVLKNIFMPFFSTKKEGTGLGLSICYNIIKVHNGSIDIESKVNEGTTFIIKLPFA